MGAQAAGDCVTRGSGRVRALLGRKLATRRGDLLPTRVTHRARHATGDDAALELVLRMRAVLGRLKERDKDF